MNIPPLIGSPEYVPTTDDEHFIKELQSRDWSVVFFAPGACRLDAANRPIPGHNSQTDGWTFEQYRELVRQYQGAHTQIVEAPHERDTLRLLGRALRNSPETTTQT